MLIASVVGAILLIHISHIKISVGYTEHVVTVLLLWQRCVVHWICRSCDRLIWDSEKLCWTASRWMSFGWSLWCILGRFHQNHLSRQHWYNMCILLSSHFVVLWEVALAFGSVCTQAIGLILWYAIWYVSLSAAWYGRATCNYLDPQVKLFSSDISGWAIAVIISCLLSGLCLVMAFGRLFCEFSGHIQSHSLPIR